MDPVVLALRAAIATKDSPELRLALGEHFLRTGDARTALAELETGLTLAAADLHLLDCAARAAEAAGEADRAGAYRLALRSLDGATANGLLASPPAPSQLGDATVLPKAVRVQPETKDASTAENDEAPSVPSAGGLRLVSRDGNALGDAAPKLTFADVAGMDDVKERLDRSFLLPLRNPALYAKFNKRIGGGLILYGPPGCGKTFVARAAAGELAARFMNVGISDVLNMWLGESERRLHELFENARRLAPTLMFFDELDALGQRRSDVRGSSIRPVVNQLLSELDGFGGVNEGVFFLAATNHPWDVDPALRRPGRFDRLVYVAPPDPPARQTLLRLKLKDRLTSPRLEHERFVRATDGFSGADIAALVELATELAIERSVKVGNECPIDDATLTAALRDLRPSTRPWFETARNYAVYANEGGTYDELMPHLRKLGLA